jgi:hypothetical protein
MEERDICTFKSNAALKENREGNCLTDLFGKREASLQSPSWPSMHPGRYTIKSAEYYQDHFRKTICLSTIKFLQLDCSKSPPVSSFHQKTTVQNKIVEDSKSDQESKFLQI